MEAKEKTQKYKVTGWHYLAAILGFTLVTQIFYWERTDKRVANVGKIDCEQKLIRLQDNYIRLYDSMYVWRPIVKQARRKK